MGTKTRPAKTKPGKAKPTRTKLTKATAAKATPAKAKPATAPAKSGGPTKRLAALRAASASWGFFAKEFELAESTESWAKAWFAGREEPARRFVVFAQDGSGGLYAFWLRDGKRPPAAPVVHLGSEREVRVLASNEDELLALLGADALGHGDERPKGHAKLRAWLKAEGIAPAKHPEALMAAADDAAPGLSRFVEAAMKGKPLVAEPARAKRAAPRTIPIDVVSLLDGPPPKVKSSEKSGLQYLVDDGRVRTIFVAPGPIGSTLRPAGHDVLAWRQADALAALGKATKRLWPEELRWDRGDVRWHLEWLDETPAAPLKRIVLSWIPSLPDHLR